MVQAEITAGTRNTDVRGAESPRCERRGPLRCGRHAPGRFFATPLEGLKKFANAKLIVGGHVRRHGGAMRGVQVHPQPKGHWPEPVLGMELELCRECLKARPESFAFSGSCGITGVFPLLHGL